MKINEQNWHQTRNQMWLYAHDEIQARVRYQVSECMVYRLRDQIRNQVWLRTWNQVGNQVRKAASGK